MKNAGLYIKCGQVIASLDLIIPDQYREQFESFCIECPATPYEDIEKLVLKTTGKEIG